MKSIRFVLLFCALAGLSGAQRPAIVNDLFPLLSSTQLRNYATENRLIGELFKDSPTFMSYMEGRASVLDQLAQIAEDELAAKAD